MAETNPNGRLETFCDGVFAIALTLLIIEIGISPPAEIDSVNAFWRALGGIAPSIFAFLLSFTIIFITWANHHACFKLIDKTCSSFIYANALLLLTVVFMPFPTALLGEYILTDLSSPAVVLYNSVFALQAIAWILLTGAALKNRLTKDEPSTLAMRMNNRNGYFAFAVYSMLAIAAIWFPQIVAAVTTVLWVFWLVHGINILKPAGQSQA
jgi:uncharacterized membrane protein